VIDTRPLGAMLLTGATIGVAGGAFTYARTGNVGRAVACGLWAGVNTFIAGAAYLASPVVGMLFSTYIGARVAIVGSIMGCG
jgi:hypothetical protein